jgi:hypothetical protein
VQGRYANEPLSSKAAGFKFSLAAQAADVFFADTAHSGRIGGEDVRFSLEKQLRHHLM